MTWCWSLQRSAAEYSGRAAGLRQKNDKRGEHKAAHLSASSCTAIKGKIALMAVHRGGKGLHYGCLMLKLSTNPTTAKAMSIRKQAM